MSVFWLLCHEATNPEGFTPSSGYIHTGYMWIKFKIMLDNCK